MDEDPKTNSKRRTRHVTSAVLRDGTMVEQVYVSQEGEVAFSVYEGSTPSTHESVDTESDERLIPYSADNNLLRNNVVLFPSEPVAYGTTEDLVAEITTYINRYVDLDPSFVEICVAYILLSWVYDGFNELPYLRVRGDYGSGKTRFLLTVGSICYRPIFASGASTVAPLFHMLDGMGGTLLVDEADFRFSDQTADIVKILNNGNARGFPVLRCESVNGKEFRPRSYNVFGPKLVATRHDYDDAALESRFITETMGLRSVKEGVPINLPDRHQDDALALRNKLLMFRFKNRQKYQTNGTPIVETFDLRTSQTLTPLLSFVSDPESQRRIVERTNREAAERRAQRATGIEGHVLEAILEIKEQEPVISISAIMKWVREKYGEDYERRITPKWIGFTVRTKLHLRTRKAHGAYVVAENQGEAIDILRAKYGI